MDPFGATRIESVCPNETGGFSLAGCPHRPMHDVLIVSLESERSAGILFLWREVSPGLSDIRTQPD